MMSPDEHRSGRRRHVPAVAGFVLLLALLAAVPAYAAGGEAGTGLSLPRAVVLGAVEGATEFIPVSSTGHLVVADHLFDRGEDASGQAEVDSFLVVVQAGAIAAVIWLYRRRIMIVARGIREPGAGRRLGISFVLAATPALMTGALLGDAIKDRLLEPLPVAVAWIVGGVLILAVAAWYRRHENGWGIPLDMLDRRTACLIGIAQVAALWHGVHRLP